MKLKHLWSILGVFVLMSLAGRVAEPQRRRPATTKPRVDYSKFSHTTHVTTQGIECDGCHKFPTKNWKDVRKGDAAFPDVAEFPSHDACLECHRTQFFARERPAPKICANCHVAVTPRNQVRHPFPSLGEGNPGNSEFSVLFPHNKHEDVIGSDQKSCATCHQTDRPQGKSDDEYLTKPPANLGEGFWLKKGTFKTVPVTHTECFTCHSTESEVPPLPSSCNVCHKLGRAEVKVADTDPATAMKMGLAQPRFLRARSRRDSAATFRHEIHSDLECTKCHVIAKLNTLEPAAMKVAVQSCGGAEGCHVTATVDDGGILNYEIEQRQKKSSFVCTKCHLSFGSQPIPSSHLQAIKK